MGAKGKKQFLGDSGSFYQILIWELKFEALQHGGELVAKHEKPKRQLKLWEE